MFCFYFSFQFSFWVTFVDIYLGIEYLAKISYYGFDWFDFNFDQA